MSFSYGKPAEDLDGRPEQQFRRKCEYKALGIIPQNHRRYETHCHFSGEGLKSNQVLSGMPGEMEDVLFG